MKYIVTVDGTDHEVFVEGESVRTSEVPCAARIAEIEGTPVQVLAIGDEVHRVLVRRRPGKGSYELWLDGFRFEVEALDERSRAIRELSTDRSGASGPAPLLAPMPGMIVRVNVSEGDQVQPGQGLVVMEAMKMENELRATAAARVKLIAVAPGTAVEKGALLLELE